MTPTPQPRVRRVRDLRTMFTRSGAVLGVAGLIAFAPIVALALGNTSVDVSDTVVTTLAEDAGTRTLRQPSPADEVRTPADDLSATADLPWLADVAAPTEETPVGPTTMPASNPAQPSNPVQPSSPVRPSNPVRPSSPFRPSSPVRPSNPVRPSSPVPLNPVQPADPVATPDDAAPSADAAASASNAEPSAAPLAAVESVGPTVDHGVEAPVVAVTDSGAWVALRSCESNGDYTVVSRSGRYRGAYQFDRSTWNSVAGRHDPALVGVDPSAASAQEQDAMALALYQERGARPWPVCGRHLG